MLAISFGAKILKKQYVNPIDLLSKAAYSKSKSALLFGFILLSNSWRSLSARSAAFCSACCGGVGV